MRGFHHTAQTLLAAPASLARREWMQIVFLQVMIAGSPVHPISSMRVYSQTTPIATGLRPCAGRSLLLLSREMAAISELMDVPGQIKYLKRPTILNGNRSMSLMPMHPIPLHSLSKNVCVYENEDKHDLLLQSIFDYGDLPLSWASPSVPLPKEREAKL